MNFKRHAEKLEKYLEDEFKRELPILVLPDKSVVYKNFKIKQDKQGLWNLFKVGGFKIDSFNLKACALMAAKHYSVNNITAYNQIKNLDVAYQQNATDASIFKYRYQTVKDIDRRDLALWRWEITDSRAKFTKLEIASKFKSMF
jgi:hypothetical protein